MAVHLTQGVAVYSKSYNYPGRSQREIWRREQINGVWTWTKSTQYFNPAGVKENFVFTVSNGLVQGNKKTPNPVSFTKVLTENGEGYLLNTGGTSTSNYQIDTGTQVAAPSLSGVPSKDFDYTSAYNRALDSLTTRTRGDLDLSIDLLEGRQTMAMLRQFKKLSQFIRGFSPRNWANKWLEYQYGWRPLVSSMYGIAETFNLPPRIGMASYQSSGSESYEKTYKFLRGSPGLYDTWTRNVSKRVRIRCDLTFSNDTLQRMAQFSSLNPASIAWELMPYSFVVDWVYDVGGYLRNLETAFLNDLAFKSGYVTYTALITDVGVRSGRENLGGQSYAVSEGKSRVVEKRKNRVLLGGYPRPMTPRIEVNLGSTRLLNGAALLSQFLGKGK
jgi:hypothetical protein